MVILIVALGIGVLMLLPRHYQATSTLGVGEVQSYLANPGQGVGSSREAVPSSIQSSTEGYLSLLYSSAVREEAKNRVQSNYQFDYSARAEPIRGSGSDLIFIDVSAEDPAVAKDVANALSDILIEETKKQSTKIADDFINALQTGQIDPIIKRLEDIRSESETLKNTPGADAAANNTRIAQLNDQALSLGDIRKQYTDIVTKVRVNQELDLKDLSIFSPAVQPSSKEPAPFLRTTIIAIVAGLILGVFAVILIDRIYFY